MEHAAEIKYKGALSAVEMASYINYYKNYY